VVKNFTLVYSLRGSEVSPVFGETLDFVFCFETIKCENMAGVTERDRADKEKTKTNESSKRSSKKAGLNEKKASNEDSSGSVLCEKNSEERVVLGSSVASTSSATITPGLSEIMNVLKSIKDNQDSQENEH
jgi:hypothetical protein